MDRTSLYNVYVIYHENVCRYQTAASSHSDKPLHVEIQDKDVVLERPSVLAMNSFESRIAVLFKSDDCISVALHTVHEGRLTLSEPRVHQLYTCRESRPTVIVPESQFTIITPRSFHQKSSSNQCSRSSGVLNIGDELFNVLFGFELNLSRCPVILLPGHSGSVLWLQMKSVIGHRVSVQVLCSLGDSLVHVLAFSSVHDDGELLSSHLALIGRHGRILVISLSSGAASPSYQHYDILGPVHCCTFFDNSYLLYSTGNELYMTSLVKSVQAGQSGCSVKSSALGISGVTALSVVCSPENNNTTALGMLHREF